MASTVTKIKKNALSLFVEKGYTETSLADIAGRVGIKKQSIYSHFKNKEELFIQIIEEVVNEEIAFLNYYFNQYKNDPLEEVLYHFIIHIEKRFTSSKEDNIKFLLHMMFTPPNVLQETVIHTALGYYGELEKHIEQVFICHEEKINVTKEEAKTAYLAFFDGLLVELVYVNVPKFKKRFQLTWRIYWRGIKK
ncbi:TetR family transcriptional regulator [Oceanobacillus oncorhynchi subsp. incaldanensis]|uniref:TetR/AcrR family transcriptional regulator n=1 Tax=Oceanobacillus aidingensis TaxID=645964 RepID=A0ABV9K2Z7_9BACI|nr:TetR/AcrR family transcriptional regulator [Oceanobacillus oncorhynchi]MDM8099807.1 TetR/AcrR family transcriptional regulator [Oceanobacillus oncorhynchi]GIO20446.1 TetR family transcriptional regulator [Oceanobacillus oncorhynchi subsp. incaldanensis]